MIKLSEVAANDEFLNIKNVSRNDIMVVHRVLSQMKDIIPLNTGGFGVIDKASKIFVRNEFIPLHERMKKIN